MTGDDAARDAVVNAENTCLVVVVADGNRHLITAPVVKVRLATPLVVVTHDGRGEVRASNNLLESDSLDSH